MTSETSTLSPRLMGARPGELDVPTRSMHIRTDSQPIPAGIHTVAIARSERVSPNVTPVVKATAEAVGWELS